MARREEDEESECDVIGCTNPALRSVAGKKFSKAVSDVRIPNSRRVHVCKDHYRRFRKKTKEDRKLERLDW
jgi:hypothetical protein